jgi:hypothetical protein
MRRYSETICAACSGLVKPSDKIKKPGSKVPGYLYVDDTDI